VRAKILFEARSCEKLRRSKAFENIEEHRKFVAQADKSREESLVSFVEIIKGKRPTVRNLWGGLAKSRQPSDLPEERGGYNCVQESKLRRLWTVGSSHRIPVSRWIDQELHRV
jgi:hypothetical protein